MSQFVRTSGYWVNLKVDRIEVLGSQLVRVHYNDTGWYQDFTDRKSVGQLRAFLLLHQTL